MVLPTLIPQVGFAPTQQKQPFVPGVELLGYVTYQNERRKLLCNQWKLWQAARLILRPIAPTALKTARWCCCQPVCRDNMTSGHCVDLEMSGTGCSVHTALYRALGTRTIKTLLFSKELERNGKSEQYAVVETSWNHAIGYSGKTRVGGAVPSAPFKVAGPTCNKGLLILEPACNLCLGAGALTGMWLI